jgi:WhiB family redox-sensing transcriptional regulator
MSQTATIGPPAPSALPVAPRDAFVSLAPGTFGIGIGSAEDANWEEPDWQGLALCAQVDGEIFFPEKGGSTREAKKVCRGCEVRAECLEYALEHDERFGIWGGLSERERRRLKHEADAIPLPAAPLAEGTAPDRVAA